MTYTNKQKSNILYGIACEEFKNEYNNDWFKMIRKLFLYGKYESMAKIFDEIYA